MGDVQNRKYGTDAQGVADCTAFQTWVFAQGGQVVAVVAFPFGDQGVMTQIVYYRLPKVGVATPKSGA